MRKPAKRKPKVYIPRPIYIIQPVTPTSPKIDKPEAYDCYSSLNYEELLQHARNTFKSLDKNYKIVRDKTYETKYKDNPEWTVYKKYLHKRATEFDNAWNE